VTEFLDFHVANFVGLQKMKRRYPLRSCGDLGSESRLEMKPCEAV
jgi:hypothetical protein